MASRLSQREWILAALVGGILFILLNLAVFRLIVGVRERMQTDLATKQAEMETLRTLFAERELWQERDAWIETHQPALENPAAAGVQLLDQIKQLAREKQLVLEKPGYGRAGTTVGRQEVSVTFETKSSWPALIDFLHALQTPEDFLVLESLRLRVDPDDPTQMRGEFRVARWYKS